MLRENPEWSGEQVKAPGSSQRGPKLLRTLWRVGRELRATCKPSPYVAVIDHLSLLRTSVPAQPPV